MWHDLRYSVRTLVSHPAFTAVAVLVLALGLGINTALFSIVYSAFFRPLPVHAPGELVYLYQIVPTMNRPSVIPYRDYEFFRDHSDAFAGLTAHWGTPSRLTVGDETETVWGEAVLANYFDVLGVKPMLGRTFLPEEDDVANTDLGMVVSHSYWMRRFGGDPNILGATVRANDWSGREKHYAVVGIMGPDFKGVAAPWTPSEYWITFAQRSGSDHRRYSIAPIGRLKSGLTPRQAHAMVAAQGEALRKLSGYRDRTRYIAVAANKVRVPFEPDANVVPVRLAAAMTIVVAIVLLIASANIAGMLLARGVGRAGEIAVRLVVGASGWRIVRQLLTESVLLAAMGGALGLVAAHWLLAVFRAYTPGRFAMDVAIEPQVVALAACVCLGVGVFIGIVPAVRAAKVDLLSALPGAGVSVRGQVRARLRHWVVIPQVGLSLVLLIVAAVHVRGLMKMELTDLGYDIRNLVVLNIGRRAVPEGETKDPTQLAEARALRSRTIYRQIANGVASIPGAAGVALSSTLPLGSRSTPALTAVSREDVHAGNPRGVGTARVAVSPGYFPTMGMSLVAGRDFDERDTMTTPRVAIVSESIAQRLWPGRDAVGRFVAARNSFPGPNEKLEWLEVIGVVNEVDPILRDVGQSPFVYVSAGQEWLVSASTMIARVHGDPLTVVQSLKRAILGADPLAEVYSARTMQQMAAEILYPRRLAAAILGASALIGLFLATVGLYGVVSYSVAQRVHEIGVRAALGAGRTDIMRLVIRDGIKVAAIGSTLGLIGTYAAIRITAKMFVAVPAPDAAIFIAVPLFLTAVVLLACYIPARRAARVDPMVVLRQL